LGKSNVDFVRLALHSEINAREGNERRKDPQVAVRAATLKKKGIYGKERVRRWCPA